MIPGLGAKHRANAGMLKLSILPASGPRMSISLVIITNLLHIFVMTVVFVQFHSLLSKRIPYYVFSPIRRTSSHRKSQYLRTDVGESRRRRSSKPGCIHRYPVRRGTVSSPGGRYTPVRTVPHSGQTERSTLPRLYSSPLNNATRTGSSAKHPPHQQPQLGRFPEFFSEASPHTVSP